MRFLKSIKWHTIQDFTKEDQPANLTDIEEPTAEDIKK